MTQLTQQLIDFADTDRREVNSKTKWHARLAPMPQDLFDGKTFEHEHDIIRLKGQLARVYNCMRDGRWRTLGEIRAHIQSGSEAGISARLRDLRKEKWGQQTVNRRRRGDPKSGTFEYQVIINPKGELSGDCCDETTTG